MTGLAPDDASATPRSGLAAFDFDGTITERDTLLGFLVAVGGRGAVGRALVRHSTGLARGVRDDAARDAAKERVLGDILRGRAHDELVEAGQRYAALLPARYRTPTVERLRWHQGESHRTAIVSASLVYYLHPVAAELGIDHVIGVEMQVDDAGRLTGALAGPNVRAGEKATRLRHLIGDGAVELWAYGNSSGDDALLAMSDHPTWVGKRAARN